MGMRFFVLVMVSFLLSACASTWETQPPRALPGSVDVGPTGSITEGANAVSSVSQQTQTAQNGGFVQPFGSNGVAAAYEYDTGYRIGAGDRLTIRVAGQPDLTGEYVVDGSGNISFPLINTLKVGGMSAPEVRREITARLQRGYLRNPAVSVQVPNLRPFFILGEVNRAGSFPYQSGMNVQNAIAIAGGYSARADQGPVMLTRKSSEGTNTWKVPLTTQVYPGDIIFIRERWF